MTAICNANRDDHHLLALVGRLARWVAWLLFAAAFWAAAIAMINTVVVESGMMKLSVKNIEPLAGYFCPLNGQLSMHSGNHRVRRQTGRET